MMMGALLGGISFHKGLGVVHSLSHALGSEGRVHHGTLNAILLPHALRFNREAAGPRMADLAGRLGLGRGGDAAGHLITLTELVLARMPLPRRLGQLEGLKRDRIAEYARLAMLDHCHRTNPRPAPRPTWKTCSIGPGDQLQFCAVMPATSARYSRLERSSETDFDLATTICVRILFLMLHEMVYNSCNQPEWTNCDSRTSADGYDAILIVGFGGPECREDVLPFLENVTTGRNVPRERLLEVAEHYDHFDGVSPINAQIRDLIAALRPELDRTESHCRSTGGIETGTRCWRTRWPKWRRRR